MSIARQHNEWLSLIEVSGPFLSLPVLLRVFPQGLEAHDTEMSKNVRLAFGEWEEHRQDVAIHTAWLEFVLKRTLGYPDDYLFTGQALPDGLEARVHEHGETLRPTYALKAPTETLPRMLVSVYPSSQALTKPVAGTTWKTGSPDTRMMTLLHATGVPLGLVTNGEKWLLVAAKPGETTSYITWDAGLWSEEPLTLRAFVALLGVSRFFGVAENEALPHMLAESALNQQEVTDQLGQQVLKAVEVLIQALDRINVEQHGRFLEGIGEKDLYQAALTVMMRLVFLLSAEERGLLLLGDALYDRHYAISTLRDQLREIPDEQLLEHRHDAWGRFLATCRVIYGGVAHEAMRLPAYGGGLFDPDRYAFLEGREVGTSWTNTPAVPLPISNRTVLHLLESLQFLRLRVLGGAIEARRLSFRALDIEQIGHVYEGLLDHTAKRASSPVLGLKASGGDDTEVLLSDLEERAACGDDELIAFLRDKTGKTSTAIRKAFAQAGNINSLMLQSACGAVDNLYGRVKPYAFLLREDSNGYPVVVRQGSLYVTSGLDRRSTGTHYTPRSLTEPVVRTTLESLVYDGVSNGESPALERLKTASEILSLKVCDVACGSGAFLVQACRYLSERLVEAWSVAEEKQPNARLVVPEALPSEAHHSEQFLPQDLEERLSLARRLVAERCLYGVDVNPMAVEMAKLSLWLTTLHKARPFTFLDHAIKCGDSLLGLHNAEQIRAFHLLPARAQERLHDFIKHACAELLHIARHKREQLEQFTVVDIDDADAKARMNQQAEGALDSVRVIADIIVSTGLKTATGNASRSLRLMEAALDERLLDIGSAYSQQPTMSEDAARQCLRSAADGALARAPSTSLGRRTFHWLVEFPEIMLRPNNPGFDAIIGNPPFLGGQKITGVLGTDYRDYLVLYHADGRRGSADLCAYFFLRASELLRVGGNLGLLAVNTIAEGDTRQVALEPMLQQGFCIYAARSGFPWPGAASILASAVHVHKGRWAGTYVLDEKTVPTISAFLSAEDEWSPKRLSVNANKSFIGSYVLGMGFTTTPEEAAKLLEKNPRNAEALFPYLSGEDMNSSPEQAASRWVINFWDWPLARDVNAQWADADQRRRDDWLRDGHVPPDYPGRVASDFPDLLEIVTRKVKPEREKLGGNASAEGRKKRWWHYGRDAKALYHAVGLGNAFARHPEYWRPDAHAPRYLLAYARHSKYWCLDLVSADYVFSDALGVNATSSLGDFAVLQSSIHSEWAWKLSSSLESRLRYTPSDVFEPFPFPQENEPMERIGESYLSARKKLTAEERVGLTQLYNQFHSPSSQLVGVEGLRDLHVSLDNAVLVAYGWHDIELKHDFYSVSYLPDGDRVRFAMCEAARLEILRRLAKLNRARYEAEQNIAATAGDSSGAMRRSSPRSKRLQDTSSDKQAHLF
ncbi:Methylase of polypeptide chain release factors [Burkholderia pseudomallei]|uniref:Eco57I restriction-modification methylase domain-containing protein n=1 Tax=Burkholderia pseudomallei TaxID=28450 RepID=UPI0009823F69|nr:DNA methyltransferase [Burkholderia pseudomallei]VBS33503.1 Methylase of polypeptide chain release factors [Burkholderia pseudomallei]